MNIPGPRTSPTIKPMAAARSGSLRSWELRLGVVQVVMLLGMAMGSMVCAFYLGLHSGQTIGFESAVARANAATPRLPIPAEHLDGAGEEDAGAFDVYARLNESVQESVVIPDPLARPSGGAASGDVLGNNGVFEKPAVGGDVTGAVPELGSIKSVDTAPLIEASAAEAEVSGDDTRAADKVLTAGLLESAAARSAAVKAEEAASADRPETPSRAAPIDTGTTTTTAAVVNRAVLPDHKAPAPGEEKIEAPSPPKLVSDAPRVGVVIPKGWYVQAAAPRQLQEANALAGKLRKSGFPVTIENARVRGEEYYRILVGPEGARAQADVLLKQLRRESYLPADPFIRMVK